MKLENGDSITICQDTGVYYSDYFDTSDREEVDDNFRSVLDDSRSVLTEKYLSVDVKNKEENRVFHFYSDKRYIYDRDSEYGPEVARSANENILIDFLKGIGVVSDKYKEYKSSKLTEVILFAFTMGRELRIYQDKDGKRSLSYSPIFEYPGTIGYMMQKSNDPSVKVNHIDGDDCFDKFLDFATATYEKYHEKNNDGKGGKE